MGGGVRVSMVGVRVRVCIASSGDVAGLKWSLSTMREPVCGCLLRVRLAGAEGGVATVEAQGSVEGIRGCTVGIQGRVEGTKGSMCMSV